MINKNLYKSLFAIAQLNTGEGPVYDSPVFLQLVDDPAGPYLQARPLSSSENIKRQQGHGPAVMQKVVDHLYHNRKFLFPDPLNRRYLKDKLAAKLISYRDSHNEINSPSLKTINELCAYLQSFEEQLTTAVNNQDSRAIHSLLNRGVYSDSKKHLILKSMEENLDIFLDSFSAEQLEIFSPLPQKIYIALFTGLCRKYTDSYLDLCLGRQLYVLVVNRPPEIHEETVTNLLDSFPQAKRRVVTEAACEVANKRAIRRWHPIATPQEYLVPWGSNMGQAVFSMHFLEKHLMSLQPEDIAQLLTFGYSVFNNKDYLKDLLHELAPDLKEKLAQSKDSKGAGLLHYISHHEANTYTIILESLAEFFNEQQRESLFRCNEQGVAPFHIALQHIFSTIPRDTAALESAWKAVGEVLRYIPSSRLNENLASNQKTYAKCLSNYLAEQLLTFNSEGSRIILENAFKNIPKALLPYIFNFTLFSQLAKSDSKEAFTTFQSVIKVAAEEDQPAIASAYLASSTCFYKYCKLSDTTYLTEHLSKPHFFQAFLEYPSLSYSIYTEMPGAFIKALKSLGGFQALAPDIQDKNCWMLSNEEIRGFIDCHLPTLNRENALSTSLPEYASTPIDFLAAVRKITALPHEGYKKTNLRLLADQFSPMCFIALTQDPAYIPELCAIFPHLPPYIAKIVSLYLRSESLAPLLVEESIPLSQRWRYAEQALEKLKEELQHLKILTNEPSKPPKEIITIVLRLSIIKETLKHLYKFFAVTPLSIDGREPSKQLQLFSPFQELKHQFHQYSQDYNSLHDSFLENHSVNELYHTTSYEPDKRFFDSILWGSIMRIPLIPPLKDQKGLTLPNENRFDASLLDKPEFAVKVEGKGIFYKNPFDNKGYRREAFKVDETLRNQIAEWKNAHPYWEKYLELSDSY